MSKLPWKPLHPVVTLRDDLRSDELTLQMLATNLYAVMMRRGRQPVHGRGKGDTVDFAQSTVPPFPAPDGAAPGGGFEGKIVATVPSGA
jgi:hypothetical protein